MNQICKSCSWQLILANYLAITGALAFEGGLLLLASPFTNSALAQITQDGTLPNNSQVTTQDNITIIKGGTTAGVNLLHSFREFNVTKGQTARFQNSDNMSSPIQNILVRVTGTSRSGILGRLETSGFDANLFLINPNGIFFGPNATLRLNGSFVASTASAIKFNDGTVFSTTAPQTTPLLTISTPLGLQFEGTAREITVQGAFLKVQPGKTLALVGGNVNLDRSLSPDYGTYLQAQSGQIALGGILGKGTIELNLDSNNQPALRFSNDVALADVSLSNKAEVNVSGEGGGYIQLQGRRIILSNKSNVVAETQGNQNGRGIFIQAEQLIIQDGSQVTASAREQATGSGGSLEVKATDFVQVTGTDANGIPSALFTETFGKGAAGNLTIETGRLIVDNGGNIAAAARPGSQGLGGTLKVVASDLVQLSGISAITGNPSGLFAETLGSNDAGSLSIDTRQLIVQDGAVITAGTGKDSQGNGGTLTVRASDFVQLSRTAPNGNPSGLFALSLGSGDAGSIFITTGQLNVRDQAQVTVSALQGGNAGNLEVEADEIHLDRQGKLNAETTSGNGGDINLQVEKLLQLRNNSQISTSAGINNAGGGNGGNIKIDTPNGFIVAVPNENSDISANAFGGKGGNVQINAFGIYGTQPRNKPTELSDITASSQFGLNGVIRITTPDVEPHEKLMNLPTQLVEPKLAQVCKVGVGRNQNSFTITGRGGVPSSPTEPLSTDAVLADWITLDKASESASNQNVTNTNTATQANPDAIAEATGWEINAKGEVVLTANASSATPHSSWQNSTDCGVAQAPS